MSSLRTRVLSSALLAGLSFGVAAPASASWDASRTAAPAPVLRVAPVSASGTSSATAVRPTSTNPATAYRAEVLRLVNVERAKAGLRPVQADACATAYAARQNAVITSAGALSHQDLGRVMEGCKAFGAGENVAYGNVTAAQMMVMWMNSPGHRANILRPTFTHLGVAATRTASGRWYATQVFLTR